MAFLIAYKCTKTSLWLKEGRHGKQIGPGVAHVSVDGVLKQSQNSHTQAVKTAFTSEQCFNQKESTATPPTLNRNHFTTLFIF